MHDLLEEQLKDNHGVPPLVVPNTLMFGNDPKPFPQAVWVGQTTTTRVGNR